MNLQAIIPYCSYDKTLIRECIKAAEQVCSKVRISHSDTLVGGQPDDVEGTAILIDEFVGNNNISFKAYDHSNLKSLTAKHNLSRNTLISDAIEDGCTHLLLIDADEIIDVSRFKKWWSPVDKNSPCYKFDCYWYFRDRTYRANTTEHAGMVVRSELFEGMNAEANERDFFTKNGVKYVRAADGEPIVHHYSWAKSKEELLMKVKNWGHMSDKNWIPLIEEEFSRDFNGTDFVHGYQYTILDEPFSNI